MQDAPWIAHYPPGVPASLAASGQHIADWFSAGCARWQQLPALRADGKVWQYQALAAEATALAGRLHHAGVRPGHSVALLMGNSAQAVISFFALWQCGAAIIPLSPLDAVPQLQHKLQDSQADWVLTQNLAPFLQVLEKLGHLPALQTILVCDACACLADPGLARQHMQAAGLLAALPQQARFRMLSETTEQVPALPAEYRAAEAIALIQYTGGTTGDPKGAVLTHSNLLTACEQLLATTRTEPPVLQPGQESLLLVLPVFHIYALTAGILLGFALGATITLHARFDAAAVAHDLIAQRITIFPAVPTMYAGLLMSPGVGMLSGSCLKFCCSGGAPLPVVLAEQFATLTGCRLLEGWGMTEAAPAGTFTPRHQPPRAGSCGLPVPGLQLKIVRLGQPEIREPAGVKGEICIKGPNVMRGYWRRAPDAATLTADGYLRTGDIGYLDHDGYLYIVDRCKDMLICGGLNVYPRVIEEAIYRHPDVAEVIVIGVPDAYRGQVARAGVVMKNGRQPLQLTQLRDFLRDHLGKHELPEQLVIREQLPKTAIGKLSKKDFLAEESVNRSV